MSSTSIWVEEAEAPNVLIDENKFELFCEIQAKDGTFQSLYVREGGTDVVVEIHKESAITGLFSTESDKVRQLFDYIEVTISPKNGLICYELESFPRLLQLAVESGGRYPLIQNEINPQKNIFLSGLLQQLRPQHFLNKTMRDKIQEHTVPCTHVTKEDLQHFAEENAADLPVVMSAENLPEGWVWKEWDNGGYLESPEGKGYFFYEDLPSGVAFGGQREFLHPVFNEYCIYEESMSFKAYAESFVLKEILRAREPLSSKQPLASQIRSASSKVSPLDAPSNVKQTSPER